jgi:hypothetical protein
MAAAAGAMELQQEDAVVAMEEMEEEIVDEYVSAFDALEVSSDATATKTAGYQALLANARVDEKALKIKEQCIYR